MPGGALLVFDDVIHGTADVYTSSALEERLAELDAIALEVVVEASGTTETTTVQIETSGDGRWWANKNPTPEIDAASTPAGARTVVHGFDAGVRPALGRVRLRIRLGISGPVARVSIFAHQMRPTSFVPGRMAGCAGWFRADMGIALSGSSVTDWLDQTGNGRHLTQALASSRPSYTASSNTFNGLPCLVFDGLDDVLVTAAFSLGVYTVCVVTSGQSGNGYFWTRSSAGVEADTLYGSVGHTTYVNRGGVVSGYNHTTSWGQWGTTTARVLVQRYGGTHATHTVRMNQTAIATTSSSGGEPGTAATSDQFVVAGRNDGYAAAGISVAEVAVFDRALGTPELELLEEYARRRYRLAF